MTTFIVAVYDTDRAFGGSEEGGWWYDCGDLIKIVKAFRNETKAYAYANRMNRILDRTVNKGRYPLSSVCCEGWIAAEVFENIAPAHYPERRPYYE